MNRDMKNNITVDSALVPVAPGLAEVDGLAVDLQGYDSATFVFDIDAVSAGVYTIQESDASGSGYTDVVANDLLGTNGAALAVGGRIGYVGSKRYVRCQIDLSVDGVVAAVVVKGKPSQAATA